MKIISFIGRNKFCHKFLKKSDEIHMMQLFLPFLFILSGCLSKNDDVTIKPLPNVTYDYEEKFEKCDSSSLTIDQNIVDFGKYILPPPDVGSIVYQSFKVQCKEGLIDSVSLRMMCYNTGFQCSLKLGLYENGEQNDVSDLVEEVSVSGIVTSPEQFYEFKFLTDFRLKANRTYWLKIENIGYKTIGMGTSRIDHFQDGDAYFYDYDDFHIVSDHQDVTFQVKIR